VAIPAAGKSCLQGLGRAKNLDKDHDLVPMLINSLFWTTLGVLVAVFAT
jgi:hypothetical protein